MLPHHTEISANGDVCADQLLTVQRPHATPRWSADSGGSESAVCYGAIGNSISVKGAGDDNQGNDNPLMIGKQDGHKMAPQIVNTDPKGGAAHQIGSDLATDLDCEEDGEPCSWGPLRPPWCQMFRSPKVVLFCLCWAGAIQGMVVNGFIGVVITTIEKRFDLASKETGIVASFYDIAAVICLIPVSYLGGFGRKPRWVATGIFVVGLGSLLFALPHFTTGLYNYDGSRDHNTCAKSPLANATEQVCKVQDFATGLNKYKYMFAIAQILHGAGATPLFTLGITYMDENLKPKMTPLYIGIFYAMSIAGPSLGYMVGGEFLKRYTDIGAVDVTKLDITPDSPMWVGAWWIGFLFSGTLAILIAIPIAGFPKILPGAAKLRADRASEVYRGSDDSVTSRPGFGTSIRDIPTAIKILVTNPTFMFLNLAGASEGILVSGFTAFTPKFIESQFSISAGLAAQLVGFATIPTGGGGTFLGGYLVKKWDLKCAGILKLCMCTSFTSLCLILVFLIRCPNAEFGGVNLDYAYRNTTLEGGNLTAHCNENCHCLRSHYDPVCGSDNVMYYSPCFAGCKGSYDRAGKKYYTDDVYDMQIPAKRHFFNCSCVDVTVGPRTLQHGTLRPGMAQEGKCGSDCQLLALFLPVFALCIFSTFCTSMPALSATLRCVPEQQRSFALGIQWILVRCLGSIPAPIFFGALIDKTCQLWQHACPDRGSCLFYDNATMGHYLLGLCMIGKGLAFFFFFMALVLYRPPVKPALLPSIPGDQVSASSTMQMIVRDKTSVESRLSGVTQGQRSPKGQGSPKGTKPIPRGQRSPRGQPRVPPKTTVQVTTGSGGQAKYKLIPQ